jgi:DNA-binding HxlR family transcriptional regulator
MENQGNNNFNSDLSGSSSDEIQQSSRKRSAAFAMTESIFACKWSAHLLPIIKRGVNRPGAITKELDGLTTKVLNECLRRLIKFGLLERIAFLQVPPKVEYHLTELGLRFTLILESIEALQSEIDAKNS